MANIKSAKKKAKQAETHRQRNTAGRSKVRTYVKKVVKAIEEGKVADAAVALREATAIMDKAASKGLIHKNKAARHKSRLTQHIKALEAKVA